MFGKKEPPKQPPDRDMSKSPFQPSSKALARTPPKAANVPATSLKSIHTLNMDTTQCPSPSTTDTEKDEEGFKIVNSAKRRRQRTKSPPDSAIIHLTDTTNNSSRNPADSPVIIQLVPQSDNCLFTNRDLPKLRVSLFKTIRCNFNMNINRSGSLDILLNDPTSVKKVMELKSVENVVVTAHLWSPSPIKTKIVLYNIPKSFLNSDLMEALMNGKGECIPVSSVHTLGRETTETSNFKTVLFELQGQFNIDKVFLFGQQKSFKPYKEKPLQCIKCLKLGHSDKYCREDSNICKICLGKDHNESNCQFDPICTNCKGKHQSLDKGSCPKYKQRAEILRIAKEQQLPIPFVAMQVPRTPRVPRPPTGLRQPTAPEPPTGPRQPAAPRTPRVPNASPSVESFQNNLIRDKTNAWFPLIASAPQKNLKNPLSENPTQGKTSRPTKLPGITPHRFHTVSPNALEDESNVYFKLASFTVTSMLISQLELPNQLKCIILKNLAKTHFGETIVSEAEIQIESVLSQHRLIESQSERLTTI